MVTYLHIQIRLSENKKNCIRSSANIEKFIIILLNAFSLPGLILITFTQVYFIGQMQIYNLIDFVYSPVPFNPTKVLSIKYIISTLKFLQEMLLFFMIEMSKQNNNPNNKSSQFFNMYVDTQIQIQVEFSYTVVNTIL